jgi:hypothetical protein
MNLADFTRRYALIVPTKTLLQYGLIRANGTSHREAVLLMSLTQLEEQECINYWKKTLEKEKTNEL